MMATTAVSLLAPIASSLIQLLASSLINAITEKGQEGKFLVLLALSLMMKFMGKGVGKTGRECNNMDKSFS